MQYVPVMSECHKLFCFISPLLRFTLFIFNAIAILQRPTWRWWWWWCFYLFSVFVCMWTMQFVCERAKVIMNKTECCASSHPCHALYASVIFVAHCDTFWRKFLDNAERRKYQFFYSSSCEKLRTIETCNWHRHA